MNDNSDPYDPPPLGRAAKIIGLAVVTTVCVVGTVAAFVYATEIFLILFLAVLFGVFLTHTSQWLSTVLPLGRGWCLAIVTTALLLVAAGGLVFFGVRIESQVAEATTQLDEVGVQISRATDQHPMLNSILSSMPFVRDLISEASSPDSGNRNRTPTGDESEVSDTSTSTGTSRPDDSRADPSESPTPGTESEGADASPTGAQGGKPPELAAVRSAAQQAIATVGRVFSTLLGLVVNSMLIFFVGLFVAVAPEKYRDGIVVLFPPDRRERTREVMDMMGDALWRWLIGRFGSMLVTGIGAGLLLLVLGVPLAFTVGVVTGLLTFIPNIGGIIALGLSILLALPQGGTVVLLVVLGYLLLQLIESYVVTPLIEQQQVSLPPALLIAFQAVMGILFGFLGAAVASPMLAAGKVAVEEAYVKDVLESSREA